MGKILIGLFIGYLFSDKICSIPFMRELKSKLYGTQTEVSKQKAEGPTKPMAQVRGSLLFPAGQRFPIEIVS